MSEEKKLILIADDDIDYLFQLKIIIESFGYKTITAESQNEAEKIIKEIKPDLAIFDLMMENQDSGFILSYKIKNKYPDVPVIISTAVTKETGIDFSSVTGESSLIKADLYIEKGINKEKLKFEIQKLLSKK